VSISLSLGRPNFRSVTLCSKSNRTDVVKLPFIPEQDPSIRCLTTSIIFFTLPETNIHGSHAEGFTLITKRPHCNMFLSVPSIGIQANASPSPDAASPSLFPHEIPLKQISYNAELLSLHPRSTATNCDEQKRMTL